MKDKECKCEKIEIQTSESQFFSTACTPLRIIQDTTLMLGHFWTHQLGMLRVWTISFL